jgi:predicted nucleic acid-binding protein
MIVVDSSVWIDFFRGHPTPAVSKLPELLRTKEVIVGDVVLCEVLKGARSPEDARTLERAMRRCELAPMSNAALAIIAARNYRELRSKGFTVRKTIDLIIGTFCIAHHHTLLHADRDFDPMEQLLGLQVVPTRYMVNEPFVRYG